VLLEHLKYLSLQLDLHPVTVYVYSSTSWRCGTSICPVSWSTRPSCFTTAAQPIPRPMASGELQPTPVSRCSAQAPATAGCAKEELTPGIRTSSRAAHGGVDGFALPAFAFRWCRRGWAAGSGDLDVRWHRCVHGLYRRQPDRAGSCRRTELSVPGAAIEAWVGPQTRSSGRGRAGLTKPMPSMPVFFWNDADGSRYRAAYSTSIPCLVPRRLAHHHRPGIRCGAWPFGCHLNRLGVRMGSADIYGVLERMPEVRDCVVVGIEQDDGGYWMPLFVTWPTASNLTRNCVRGSSPQSATAPPEARARRHSGGFRCPRTLTGKSLEIPIKRILLGVAPADAVQRSSVDRPELFDVSSSTADRRSPIGVPGSRVRRDEPGNIDTNRITRTIFSRFWCTNDTLPRK